MRFGSNKAKNRVTAKASGGKMNVRRHAKGVNRGSGGLR